MTQLLINSSAFFISNLPRDLKANNRPFAILRVKRRAHKKSSHLSIEAFQTLN